MDEWLTPAVPVFSFRVFSTTQTWGRVYVRLFSSLQEAPDSIAHLHMGTTVTQSTEGDKLFFSTAIFTMIYSVQPVQFSCSVMSDSLQPHALQHARPPCPSPTLGVYSNSCPLSRWCHPTSSSSVVPFSSHLQSFPESGSFQMSQFFASCGQSIAASASASVLPMNTQNWSPSWTGWISLQSKEFSRVFSNTTVQKHQFSGTQLSL